MKSLQVLATICSVVLFGGLAAQSPKSETGGTLLGVPVDSIWRVANFINPEFLAHPPTFSKQGADFVGSASFNAVNPKTSRPMGLDITWTISVIDEKGFVRTGFTVPPDAQYVVTGHFNYVPAKTSVDTYSIVSVRNGSLVPQPLGYKTSDGTTMPSSNDLARMVFETLRVPSPITNQITLQQ